jgi:hypothetical protein
MNANYKRIKVITSHAGLARFLAECDEPPIDAAFIPTPRDIPSPYAHSPSTFVYLWGDLRVFWKEISHKRYEVYQLLGVIATGDYATLTSDDIATAAYIADRFPNAKAAQA